MDVKLLKIAKKNQNAKVGMDGMDLDHYITLKILIKTLKIRGVLSPPCLFRPFPLEVLDY